MRGGIDQQRNNIEHLDERARPAVQEQQRDRVRISAGCVHEVDPHVAYARPVVLELVESRLLCTPFETVLPIGDKLAQVGCIRPVRPPRPRELIGPPGSRQAFVEVAEDGLGHINGESLNGAVCGHTLGPSDARHENAEQRHDCA